MSDASTRRRSRGSKQPNATRPADPGPSALVGHGTSRGTQPAIRSRARRPNPSSSSATATPPQEHQGPEHIAKCVRRLLDSGASTFAELNPQDLKLLKQRCRTSDTDLTEAHSTLFGTLGLRRAASSRPRLVALLLLDYLFTRSELARSLTFPLLNDFAVATIGPTGCNVDRIPAHLVLPPPKHVATLVRDKAVRCAFEWCQQFGASEPLLMAFVDRLHSTYAIDFSPFRAELAAQRAAQQATAASQAAARTSALREATDLTPSVADFVSQFTTMLNIAAPTVDEMLAADMNLGQPLPPAPAPTSAHLTYADMSAVFGLGSTTYRLDIDLHGPGSATATDGQPHVAPALLAEVDRTYRRAVVHVLPKLEACFGALEAVRVHFARDPEVASAMQLVMRLKEQVGGLVQRAEALGCSVLAEVREEDAQTQDNPGDDPNVDDEADEDLEFEDVPIPDLSDRLSRTASPVLSRQESPISERELFGTPSPPPSPLAGGFIRP